MRIESVLIPATRWVVNRPRLANALFRFDPWGSPFTDEFVNDPMSMAEAIRADGPVKWKPLYQQWMITGYPEAQEVLKSPSTGTENQMDVLLDVRPYSQTSPASQQFFANFLLLVDPPRHTRLRSLVNRAFTPKQVSNLDDRMRKLVAELIAEFRADHVELMSEFAMPFPAAVIADLFGLERDDWSWLRSVSDVIAKLTDPIRAFDPAEMDAAIDSFRTKILALAAERRADPRDDLMTGLALAEAEDGDRLTENELVAMAGIILVAGHETTAGMIGLAMLNLSEHRDQLELLADRPDLWPNAVDELLRYDTSIRTIPRAALEDFELAGRTIKAGQNIAINPQMANRDPRRGADANELRVDREDPAPLSFGHGIHYCLGANLAKAELRVALPALVDALGSFEIDRSQVEWNPSILLRRPNRLPITRG